MLLFAVEFGQDFARALVEEFFGESYAERFAFLNRADDLFLDDPLPVDFGDKSFKGKFVASDRAIRGNRDLAPSFEFSEEGPLR